MVFLNKINYNNNENEFIPYFNAMHYNLKLYNDLPKCEIIVGLLSDIADMYNDICLTYHGFKFGGYIPLNCKGYNRINYMNFTEDELNIIKNHVLYQNNNNDSCVINVIYIEDINNINITDVVKNEFIPYILCRNKLTEYAHSYYVDTIDHYIHIPDTQFNLFYEYFRYYIKDDVLNYDNLIQLIMIVKNAGNNFENILKENYDIFDRWTILDTGSTDNTVETIKHVLINKKGNLYEEPFINFKESRNRSLDLAKNKCKFNIILDDTYIVKNNIRAFLKSVRSDQLSDSFSIYIQSNDVIYGSNRIIKSETNLRYKFKIHEVIDNIDNKNVMIPYETSYIYDNMDVYMVKRTAERKNLDIQLLNEMIEEEPDNPRHLYYLAQTYKLMKQYDKTEEYYLKRINHPNEGFVSELIDTYFELARLYNFLLHRPWEECLKYYLKAYELDPDRPDSLYYIGMHYYYDTCTTTDNIIHAYEYLKKAFLIGIPLTKQYSVKPTLSYYYIPKFLIPLCYMYKDYTLGLNAAELFLNKNDKIDNTYVKIKDWHIIFTKLLLLPPFKKPIILDEKIICFIADGGFEEWTGSDINTKGIGGAETHIIEMSRHIKRQTHAEVVVFCNTAIASIFEGVKYFPLKDLYTVIRQYYIDICFISRYSEYIPVAINSYINNIYIFIHDVTLSGQVIINVPKVKKIFCLTNWHKSYFDNMYPALKDKTTVLGNGCNMIVSTVKQPYRFIYSSFANRGLLPLLMMWDEILNILPSAELHVYCDLNNKWLNTNCKTVVDSINRLLPKKNVIMHGWVCKKELHAAWAKSHIWLYPCTFMETFCITALEAAQSKTLVITNNLAGLNDTVADRGYIVEGDATTDIWKTSVLHILSNFKNTDEINRLITKNYEWACTITWEMQCKRLLKIIGCDNNDNGDMIAEMKSTFKWMNELICTF